MLNILLLDRDWRFEISKKLDVDIIPTGRTIPFEQLREEMIERWRTQSWQGVGELLGNDVTDVPWPLVEGISLPRAEDVGHDLVTPVDVTLWPLQRRLIKTGCRVAMPIGMEGDVRSRSSVGSRKLILLSGTVDSGYRGDVSVNMMNLALWPRRFRAGDRIAQIVFRSVHHAVTGDVDSVPSQRGVDGWGSSGR